MAVAWMKLSRNCFKWALIHSAMLSVMSGFVNFDINKFSTWLFIARFAVSFVFLFSLNYFLCACTSFRDWLDRIDDRKK